MNDLAVDTALESLPLRIAALRDRTVLYIDDNAANRRLVERIFDRRPDLERSRSAADCPASTSPTTTTPTWYCWT